MAAICPTVIQTKELGVGSSFDTLSCHALSSHLCSCLMISGEAAQTPLGVCDAFKEASPIDWQASHQGSQAVPLKLYPRAACVAPGGQLLLNSSRLYSPE